MTIPHAHKATVAQLRSCLFATYTLKQIVQAMKIHQIIPTHTDIILFLHTQILFYSYTHRYYAVHQRGEQQTDRQRDRQTDRKK